MSNRLGQESYFLYLILIPILFSILFLFHFFTLSFAYHMYKIVRGCEVVLLLLLLLLLLSVFWTNIKWTMVSDRSLRQSSESSSNSTLESHTTSSRQRRNQIKLLVISTDKQFGNKTYIFQYFFMVFLIPHTAGSFTCTNLPWKVFSVLRPINEDTDGLPRAGTNIICWY